MSATSASKPTVLLVHGAWHSPLTWSLLIPELESLGYPTTTVALPSASATNVRPDATADVTTVASAITSISDEGNDVVLLMHSYGGVPGSSGVKGLTKTDRKAQGKPGGVIHLIYLAAFLLDEGVSLMDAVSQGDPNVPEPDWWLPVSTEGPNKAIMPGDPVGRFYADISDQEVLDRLVKDLRPQARGALFWKALYAPWREVPTTYIACEQDAAIPIVGQKGMVGLANAWLSENKKGREVGVVVLDSSHSPMISMPKELAGEVAKAVEAQ